MTYLYFSVTNEVMHAACCYSSEGTTIMMICKVLLKESEDTRKNIQCYLLSMQSMQPEETAMETVENGFTITIVRYNNLVTYILKCEDCKNVACLYQHCKMSLWCQEYCCHLLLHIISLFSHMNPLNRQKLCSVMCNTFLNLLICSLNVRNLLRKVFYYHFM